MTGMIRCDRVIVERAGQMVVDRLSLEISSGTALAVIGRSGAGKTALVAALATAEPVRGGDVQVCGLSVRRESDAVRRRIGYAPAQLVAWPAVRADDFLALFATASGLRGPRLEAAVALALEAAGLAGRGGVALDAVDAGRAKRLLIARALLHSPDVLLLDDPFSGLDPDGQRWLARLIDDLRLAGRTVVAAIDDACVPDCFTDLAVLEDGRLVAHGPADMAAFSADRAWRWRVVFAGPAEPAAARLERLADRVEAVDGRTLDCVLRPDGQRPEDIVAALVHDGFAVTAAGLHPCWTAQLIDPPR
jgi:ABC-2 type transport system ATP-binding protein